MNYPTFAFSIRHPSCGDSSQVPVSDQKQSPKEWPVQKFFTQWFFLVTKKWTFSLNSLDLPAISFDFGWFLKQPK